MRREKAESKIRKYVIGIILAFTLLLILAAVYAYAVYYGYIWLNCPSKTKYPVWGIDVSHYQGENSKDDWKKLIDGELKAKGHEISFAYIKATEGSKHVDPQFLENWSSVKESSSGFRAGAYHSFSFESQGLTQLENFTSQVDPIDRMLAPAVDLEFYRGNEKNPPEKSQILRELKVMLEGLESAYNMLPVIYVTEESYEYFLAGEKEFEKYPLWVRNVKSKPKGLDRLWTFWQFTNRGTLKDQNGKAYFGSQEEPYVDINVFFGHKGQFINEE